jgi:outer membrane protein assembly factor BamA
MQIYKLLLAVYMLMAALYANAQDSQQAAQADSALLEGNRGSENIFSKAMGLLEFNIGRSTWNIFPALGNDPSSGADFGLMPIVTIPPKPQNSSGASQARASSLFARMSYSTKHWANIALDFKLYPSAKTVSNFLLEAQRMNESFYGIGSAYNGQHVSYMQLRTGARGDWSRSVGRSWLAGAKYEFSFTELQIPEQEMLSSAKPGYRGGIAAGAGPYLAYDSRDDSDWPNRGVFASASLAAYPKLQHSSASFWRANTDARFFLPLPWGFIGAAQMQAEYVQGEAPFYMLPRLAGRDRLRGIGHRSKFIDNGAAYAQVELRRHLIWRLGAAAFAGMGNTFPGFGKQNGTDMKYVAGFGGRMAASSKSKMNLRFDVGFASNGDYGMYMTAREAF